MNNDIIIFEDKEVTAGFSRKPDDGISGRRELYRMMAENPDSRGSSIKKLIRPRLVHGKHVEIIDEAYLEDKAAYVEISDCDGTITNLKGVMLTTTHGDCIPVYAYDPVKQAIGLSHAGWKGTMLGVAGEMVEKMKAAYSSEPKDILCYIGPGIDKCHFEVSEDVRQEFLKEIPWSEKYIASAKTEGKYMIDLKSVNEEFLRLSGVVNIEISEDCTYCLEDLYYSYRRCADTKRMLAYIIL